MDHSREQPQSLFTGPNFTSPPTNINPNSAVMAPATAQFHFGSLQPPQPPQSQPQPQPNYSQLQSQSQSQPLSQPRAPPPSNVPAGHYDGVSSPALKLGSGSGTGKKRGRPRKHNPEGTIALGLAPMQAPSTAVHGGGGGGGGNSGSPSPMTGSKRPRGRPPGSGSGKKRPANGAGLGFTPHILVVESGEDITSKIVAFSQQARHTVCVLSASGTVSNVTIRQPAISGGIATYEGRFEILALSGSLLQAPDKDERSKIGGLSVALSSSDGRVMGGGVAGVLIAAAPVQVVMASFIVPKGKKSSANIQNSEPSSAPTSQMLSFGAPVAPTSPTSQGPSSESSEGNDDIPLNMAPGHSNNVNQPVHNVQMYHHSLWAGQTHQ